MLLWGAVARRPVILLPCVNKSNRMPVQMSGSAWPCENADLLRRRRMAFSSIKCSFLLARGPPLAAYSRTGAEI
jgi:hypothetical protein